MQSGQNNKRHFFLQGEPNSSLSKKAKIEENEKKAFLSKTRVVIKKKDKLAQEVQPSKKDPLIEEKEKKSLLQKTRIVIKKKEKIAGKTNESNKDSFISKASQVIITDGLAQNEKEKPNDESLPKEAKTESKEESKKELTLLGRCELRTRQFSHPEEFGKMVRELSNPIRSEEVLNSLLNSYKEYIKIPRQEQLKYLGAVSDIKAEYFNLSDSSIRCAQIFLGAFFQLYAGVILNKYRTLQGVVHPGVITFIPFELTNNKKGGEVKRYCLISTSISKNKDFTAEIRDMTQQLNKAQKEFKFIFPSVNFKKRAKYLIVLLGLLQELENKEACRWKNISKPCAEKFYIPYLMHLFAKYKENIHVMGAINCKLFPYNLHDFRRSYSELHVIQFLEGSNAREVIDDSNKKGLVFAYNPYEQYRAYQVPCCKNCIMYKDSVLALLLWAQQDQVGRSLLQEYNITADVAALFTEYDENEEEQKPSSLLSDNPMPQVHQFFSVEPSVQRYSAGNGFLEEGLFYSSPSFPFFGNSGYQVSQGPRVKPISLPLRSDSFFSQEQRVAPLPFFPHLRLPSRETPPKLERQAHQQEPWRAYQEPVVRKR